MIIIVRNTEYEGEEEEEGMVIFLQLSRIANDDSNDVGVGLTHGPYTLLFHFDGEVRPIVTSEVPTSDRFHKRASLYTIIYYTGCPHLSWSSS
ncbi:hypothetical protein AVEN_13450-1 [Araneus ventricosus]|uniref:Uncharacterized protein n=1 Tax=Araneus ventricosus TaxID=182803 RepID=A0A4Y2HUX0_ARAVE|nr:hypothetical protein AVEN_13450-1 [Araneus ventricosus]